VGGAIAAEGGYVDRTEGDAFVATFTEAAAGARAAVRAQRAVRGHAWPPEVGLSRGGDRGQPRAARALRRCEDRAPEHHDQPAKPPAVEAVANDAHDRDDLLNVGGSAGYRRPLLHGG
jgi:hypothetical protein